jgi:hypothetical protein
VPRSTHDAHIQRCNTPTLVPSAQRVDNRMCEEELVRGRVGAQTLGGACSIRGVILVQSWGGRDEGNVEVAQEALAAELHIATGHREAPKRKQAIEMQVL